MSVQQSDELTAFYQDYLDWVEAGAIETEDVYSYSPGRGLCGNLAMFTFKHDYYGKVFEQELLHQFKDAGLDTRYPFNKDPSEYSFEAVQDMSYQNPKRLAWVKEHAK